jgi:hypothetical protein
MAQEIVGTRKGDYEILALLGIIAYRLAGDADA